MAAPSSNASSRFAGANRAALIIVGVLSLLGLAYAIARVDILRARIVDLRTDLSRTTEQQNETAAQLRALQGEQQQQLAQLQQAQDTLNHLSSGLNKQIAQATEQWTRAEVLYLCRLAQDQLLHAHDLNTARDTLDAALTRSRAQPGVIPDEITQQLQSSLTALSALPPYQEDRIKDRLQRAEAATDNLTLASTNTPPTEARRSTWQAVKQAFRQLVLVRRSGEQVSTLISSTDVTLQRQYLRQQLLSARLAAARHDQQAYTQALDNAAQWLQQAFDIQQPTAKNLSDELTELRLLNVAPALPDLSGNIAQLQQLLNNSPLGSGAAR